MYRQNKYIDNPIFLGDSVDDPALLQWQSGRKSAVNLAYISPNNMGIIPTRTYQQDLLITAIKLKQRYNYPWSEIWVRVVGERILSPFNLNPIDSEGQPNKYLGATKVLTEQNIAGISVGDFQLIVDTKSPPVVFNTSIFSDYHNKSYELIPYEIDGMKNGLAPILTGGNRIFGGGFISSYGFASQNPIYLTDNIASTELNITLSGRCIRTEQCFLRVFFIQSTGRILARAFGT